MATDLPVLPIRCSELLPDAGMTRCARILVTQEARVCIVIDCPCVVQLITPPSKDVFMAIDETPEDLGPNRMPYLSPPVPTEGRLQPMRMASGQFIVLATRKEIAICGVVIERLPGGVP